MTDDRFARVVVVLAASALAVAAYNGSRSAPSVAPAAQPSRPTSRAMAAPRRFAVDCGDHESLAAGSTDRSGSFIVGARAPIHGDVGVCVVAFPDARARSCDVVPGRYTATPGLGKLEIVGPQRGELVRFRCDPR
jgi:hypothetical protein